MAATMTATEWAERDEDAEGELVDGVLVEDEMGGFLHEGVVAWLIGALHAWAKETGARVAASDARFAIRRDRGRKPDISVYLASDRKPPSNGVIRTPPSVMIEVVTPVPRDRRRDRVEKVADYAEFGVRYYWLVDPELRTLEILELGLDGRYVHALGAVDGSPEVPGCPGLVLDLDELWREVDSLSSGGP